MSFELPAMPSAETSALVAMVGKGRGWPTKGQLVLAIGAVEGGDWCTSGDLAAHTGLGDGTCRRLMAQLEAERVILRDSGGGDRRFWCEVNPDWERWDVPWRLPRVAIRRQLAWVRERQAHAPLTRFCARPMHARYARISARLIARANSLEAAGRSQKARDIGRAQIGTEGERSARNGTRAKGVRERAPQERALIGGSREEEEITSHRDGNTPPQSPTPVPAPGPEETNVEGVIVRAEDWARARAAVLRRSVGQGGRAPFVAGRVARSLAQLVHRWGADQVETAADKVQQGTHMPPRFVELLGDVLEAPTIAEGPWAGQQQFPDRPRIEARLAGVDQHLAIFRQEMGDDRDPPEDLLRERDDLVRQLDLIDS